MVEQKRAGSQKNCQSKPHLIGDPMRAISLSDFIYCKSEGKPQERLTIHNRVGKIKTPLYKPFYCRSSFKHFKHG